MKKSLLALSLLSSALSVSADMAAYQVTALNTPQTGYMGQVVGVQACSTNATGTATISSVTDLLVNRNVVSFTNELASVTLANGVGSTTPSNVFVAPKQRIIVSGNAFPGGSAILWLSR